MQPLTIAETRTSPEWISGRQARLRLGLTPAKLFKLVATDELRVQANRGESLKYCSADVERIAAERGLASTS